MTRVRRLGGATKATIGCVLTVAGLVAGGVLFARFASEPAYTAEELRAFGFVGYPTPRDIPPFHLRDADGNRFDASRLRGKWSLLFFGYANCPDICPLTMSTLALAEERLAADETPTFQGVLVSVDPERDTPAALREYVAEFSAGFVGVTGEVAAIEAFAESLHAGFAKAPVSDSALGYLMDHSSHLAVVDPQGRHRGYVGAPLDARKIASLVRALATQ